MPGRRWQGTEDASGDDGDLGVGGEDGEEPWEVDDIETGFAELWKDAKKILVGILSDLN